MAKKGNLRFTNKNSLPHEYKRKFLKYVHELAPEVEETLKELIPGYRAVIRKCSRNERLRDWILQCGSDGFSEDHPAFTRLDRGVKSAILKPVEPTWESKGGKRDFDTFLELRDGFEHFLEHFGLTTYWLKNEYLMRLRILSKKKPNQFAYISTYLSVLEIGKPIMLEIKGWNVRESWLEFEARARLQFESALAENKEETIKHFEARGYKRATKPHDFTPVKWLVYWTVKKLSKGEVLAIIDKENESSGRILDQKTLEHHFRELPNQYDLPLRQG